MGSIPALVQPSFPLVVSGPSGVGKTVLCDFLIGQLPWTRRSVSATTREPRAHEKDGESYYFFTKDRFEREREAGGMAEWAEVHGCLYGTPRRFVDEQLGLGCTVVLNIDVQGGLQIRKRYPEAVLVFLLPPSVDELEARLRRRRTDPDEKIARRLEQARREIEFLPCYDYVIVNAELEAAAAELVAIAQAERARVARRLAEMPASTREGVDR